MGSFYSDRRIQINAKHSVKCQQSHQISWFTVSTTIIHQVGLAPFNFIWIKGGPMSLPCYLFWCSPGVGSLKKSMKMPLRIHMANDGNFDQPPNLYRHVLGSWGAPDFFPKILYLKASNRKFMNVFSIMYLSTDCRIVEEIKGDPMWSLGHLSGAL